MKKRLFAILALNSSCLAAINLDYSVPSLFDRVASPGMQINDTGTRFSIQSTNEFGLVHSSQGSIVDTSQDQSVSNFAFVSHMGSVAYSTTLNTESQEQRVHKNQADIVQSNVNFAYLFGKLFFIGGGVEFDLWANMDGIPNKYNNGASLNAGLNDGSIIYCVGLNFLNQTRQNMYYGGIFNNEVHYNQNRISVGMQKYTGHFNPGIQVDFDLPMDSSTSTTIKYYFGYHITPFFVAQISPHLVLNASATFQSFANFSHPSVTNYMIDGFNGYDTTNFTYFLNGNNDIKGSVFGGKIGGEWIFNKYIRLGGGVAYSMMFESVRYLYNYSYFSTTLGLNPVPAYNYYGTVNTVSQNFDINLGVQASF